MHVNQTAEALAFNKRDADDNDDIEAEYEGTMKEIAERKKTCKKLAYASKVTGLVNNLIGDIPDIPLVTKTVKLVTSGITAVNHVAEFGMDIASTTLQCDDINFDEITALMEKRFSEMDRKLDKMSEAMEKVTEMVTKTLESVEKTRMEMNSGFRTVLATLKNREIQSILSKIDKFATYFEEKIKEISKLPSDQFVFRLKEKDGILDYLKTVRMPEGLHSDLFELMDKNNNFAIPENANDSKAFQALYALFYGTQTYASVMFFLLKQHSYLADYYYQKGRDKEFNEAFDILETTFNEFKTSLTSTKGLINEVVKTLDEVKEKEFIKDVTSELYDDISNREDALKELKFKITKMVLNVIEDTPEPVLDIDFNKPDIASNYGDWDDKSKVRYAVQFRGAGTYSKFSDWSDPLKVSGKANPSIKVPRDEMGRDRLVFRKFNEEKFQLVGVLSKNQIEFRDIDRDLYEAARSKDQTRPLEYIPTLLAAGANINTTFEMNRNVMHAAAESGNVNIAMQFFLGDPKSKLLNAADEKGFTPMHIATMTKNAGFVSFLVDQKADVNAQTNVDKLTPLHMAAKRGYSKAIKNLLANNKIEINKTEKSGYTPLHYAVRGSAKTVKTLLENNKTLANPRSDFGFTPFHLAVMKGDREICDALLSSGKVEKNVRNKDNMTPLHFAAMAGNADMIQYLLSVKLGFGEVDINPVTSGNHWTPLYFAIYFKHEDAALELLKNNKIDIRLASKERYTPLHLSVATGQAKVFDELINKDPNLEALTKEKFTALHLAALRSDTDFTEKLLNNNANIDAIANDDSTPLHLATKADRTDQALLLINRGASMRLFDSKNFLALKYAIKNFNLDVLRAAVNKDHRIYDDSVVGKALTEYSVEYIFKLIYLYHKNKDSIKYRKYKGLSSLEVFKNLGYYELLSIVSSESSKQSSKETSATTLIEAADSLITACLENESEQPCNFSIFKEIISKRSIGDFESTEYRNSPKFQPINFWRSYINPPTSLSGRNLIASKPTGGSKNFSNSLTSALPNVDTNGMLLLLDIFIRKFTNEKFQKNLNKPMSTLESQAKALEIVDKFRAVVDTVSGSSADELMDLAKLHSDLFKSIEGEHNKIFDLLCNHLQKIIDINKIPALVSSIMTLNGNSTDQAQGDPIKTIVQYCLSDAYKGNIS